MPLSTSDLGCRGLSKRFHKARFHYYDREHALVSAFGSCEGKSRRKHVDGATMKESFQTSDVNGGVTTWFLE